MRKYIFGFIVGLIIGSGGVVLAQSAMGIWLQDANGNIMGSSQNPLYVTTN